MIGETGTGCGVGLAWLASGADAKTRIVSAERDEDRSKVARDVFRGHPNVTVLNADWEAILDHGPFHILVLDGGGSGKADQDIPVEPKRALVMFGTVVIDDFSPTEEWPPTHDGNRTPPGSTGLSTPIFSRPRSSYAQGCPLSWGREGDSCFPTTDSVLATIPAGPGRVPATETRIARSATRPGSRNRVDPGTARRQPTSSRTARVPAVAVRGDS